MQGVLASKAFEFQTNISHDLVAKNVHHSSERDLAWLALQPATDRPCLLIAGGPSLVNDIERIRQRQHEGAYLIALNGVANYLKTFAIDADALVLLDARQGKNIAFISDNPAKRYYLASQCDAEIFDALKGRDVVLFHLDLPGIAELVPPGQRQIQAVGGGATVGLIAMSLAYTLGYRDLHLFGYDSSYTDGQHHAYTQSSNDADDVVEATCAGRTFKAAPWMLYQIEQFELLVPQLMKLDCTITTHGTGLLPWVAWQMTHTAPIPEAEKYRRLWAFPEYREVSPGEKIAETFIDIAKITARDRVIDFGCGTGRGGKRVRELTGCEILQIDLVENCRDEGIDLPFMTADVTQPLDAVGDVGFCCDLLEHLPTQDVESAIRNIMFCTPECFFQIGLFQDSHGVLIGQTLHLTVESALWWRDLFRRLGYIVHYESDDGMNALFCVSTT